ATDPINPNVHPLIYRWNGILGQSQAAALEAAGKDGIIYNSTYTNFWQGAMAWSGWWHNQIGLLTEVASARVAAPIDQLRAVPGRAGSTNAQAGAEPGRGAGAEPGRGGRSGATGSPTSPLPAPTDIMPRTEYPRPWLGGHWTLRDIVDYELIATMALLDTVADRREALLEQIYAVNQQTIEAGRKGDPSAILIPVDTQHDPHEAFHLVEKLQMAGVDVYKAGAGFDADGQQYAAGTFVVPMTQVFARYAKDILEKQTYPEVRRSPTSPPEPPYDVTAWSLGMLLGVDHVVARQPIVESAALQKLPDTPVPDGRITGNGSKYVFDYRGADDARAINRVLKDGGRVAIEAASGTDGRSARIWVTNVSRKQLETIATALGLRVKATDGAPPANAQQIHAPRIGMYQPWAGGNMDEGWTRWVLEQYQFTSTPLHNADVRGGKLRERYDAIILPDQNPRSILEGVTATTIRPEYRGGIGEEGLAALREFVAQGGTLITLGAAADLAIEKFGVPVKDLKVGLTRDQHFAPGTILRVEVDTAHPIGYGVNEQTYGFYNNSPFFSIVEGFSSQKTTVVARYPNADIVASGWLKGEELMAGRAAVVAVDMNPGRIVLFGLRPQHRAQTHATFPLLFNALYLSAGKKGTTAFITN
ncbi:MAG TPA: hypothetical protein VH458_03805, partial [Vicinamibacterales bacterium]